MPKENWQLRIRSAESSPAAPRLSRSQAPEWLKEGQTKLAVVSFYDSIRPRQHVWRNRQADLLGGFEIDHQFKFRRLLHRQLSRLGSLEYFVHVGGGAPMAGRGVRSVVHKPTSIHGLTVAVHRR